MSDAGVVCMSLVHWEDPRSGSGSCEWDREGAVWYRSPDTLNMLHQQVWRRGHAVLK